MSEEHEFEQPEDDVEMGFFEHLADLRKRIILSLLGILPCIGGAWFFKEYILEWLARPMLAAVAKKGVESQELHAFGVAEPFVVYLKVSALAGVIVASPWIFFQLWSFIAPGLYRRERLLAIPFVFFSTLCFVGGVAFAYFIVFEDAIGALLEFTGMLPGGGIEIKATLSLPQYLGFAVKMLIAFGVVFEVPVVVTFLALLDIVNYRQLLDFGRWWIVVAAVLAAFLTPPDVVSQLFLLGPLVFLYYLSVIIAYFIAKRREAREPSEAEL